jgi:hypothetical protein
LSLHRAQPVAAELPTWKTARPPITILSPSSTDRDVPGRCFASLEEGIAMKPVRMLSAALALLVLSATGAPAQESPKPGPEHEVLKQLVGTWDAQVKCLVPGQAAQESKGEYTARLDVGGLFLVTEFKGQLAGGAFQGRGLTGYDPFKKKYRGVWVDSMSPGIFTSEGAFDKSGKIFTETMERPDPQGKPMKMRLTTELKDKDHMTFKMYARGEDGKENMMMEIAYTRK